VSVLHVTVGNTATILRPPGTHLVRLGALRRAVRPYAGHPVSDPGP
jgi:hypothetical protein